jgi:serine/threonine-protein kinase
MTLPLRAADPSTPPPADGAPGEEGPSLVGQVLGDRYRIVRELGTGGMGRVFLAEHVVLGKKLAVKVLRDEFSRHPDLVKRFQQEAVSASQIGQENIVDVSDFGQTPEGSFYFVMEYIPGQSLANLVDGSGAVPPERALPLLLQTARALMAAHSRGIVHRDVKPDNVLIGSRSDGSELAKVLDFGISKVSEGPGGKGQARLTQMGMVVGTPLYMSPEQGMGDPVDSRSDIYSFGVMAYELLTGTLPFDGENPVSILMKHQTVKPQPMRERKPDLKITRQTDALVMKCMSKLPGERPQNMGEVCSELTHILSQMGISVAGGVPAMGATMLGMEATTGSMAAAGRSPTHLSNPPTPSPMLLGDDHAQDLAAIQKPRTGLYVGIGAVALVLLLWGGSQLKGSSTAVAETHTPVAKAPEPIVAPTPVPEPKVEAKVEPKPEPKVEAVPALQKLALTSVPAGALVTSQGKELGKTPLSVDVPVGGTVKVELTAAGFKREELSLQGASPLEVTLTKLKKKAPAATTGAPTPEDDKDPYGKVEDVRDPYK